MRLQTQTQFQSHPVQTQTKPFDLIEQTRFIIKNMPLFERFNKACEHVNDALQFKHPRTDISKQNLSSILKIAYYLQTSYVWNWILYLVGYFYMYTIVLDEQNHFTIKIILEAISLVVFWIDIFMYFYHQSFEIGKVINRFQRRFYLKIVIIFFLTIDLVMFIIFKNQNMRSIRPFRLLRGFVPIFFDSIMRKSFEALISTYKQIIIYVFTFYTILITVSFMCGQFFVLTPDIQYDQYATNYWELDKTFLMLYAGSSPYDNQLLAVKYSYWLYLLLLIYYGGNILFISVIPTSVIFDSFKKTRSKTILIDQIRQQNSLIIAFVSLGEQNFTITTKKIIQFLLHFYKYKIRYVKNINQILMELDCNNNGSIQVCQFMQLCKIIQTKPYLRPPNFQDWTKWIKFRTFVNQKLKLKLIVTSFAYKFISNFIVILMFTNAITYLFYQIQELKIIDNLFEGLFVFDIILRLIGIGPQNFFKDKWNHLDILIVTFVLILNLVPYNNQPHNISVICKMLRIYRIITLIKLLKPSLSINQLGQQSLLHKIRALTGQTFIILPLILKFFPFILITYYFFGIVGMEIFYTLQTTTQPTSQSTYGFYEQFSNWDTFMNSQFLIMQVFAENGWQDIVYDLSVRAGSQFYILILIYFCLIHISSVLVLMSLMRGLVWQAYQMVDQQLKKKQVKQARGITEAWVMLGKREQLIQIRKQVQQSEFLIPNTVIKRSFMQSKLDIEILDRLKSLYSLKSFQEKRRRKRSTAIEQIVFNHKNYVLSPSQSSNDTSSINSLVQRVYNDSLGKIEQECVLEEEDFQEEMEDLLLKIILHPKTSFSQTIGYPQVLLDFLNKKLIEPFKLHYQQNFSNDFNVDHSIIDTKNGILFHTYALQVLMNIQKSSRDQKLHIVKGMIDMQLITEQQAKQLFSGSQTKSKHYNIDWILRKMYMHTTNEQLVNKFQIQYFSDIYGSSFKQINKVTIQPLLRYQAILTYSLRNLLRYPNVQRQDFFQILAQIQNSVSNSLLKKGSLFKFVYQIDSFTQNWFTVEPKQNEGCKIHFLKTGIWIYHKHMKVNSIYYSSDFFNQHITKEQDSKLLQKILKLLYQTFQSLAFGLSNQSSFFESNPVDTCYDLFSYFSDVSEISRMIKRKKSISKIMLVILTREQQRKGSEVLQYSLSDIKSSKRKKKQVDFKFDQYQKDTFEKLKRFVVLDREKILQTEGLPFAYVLDLIREVMECLQCYQQSLVKHVQSVLNQQFQKLAI